MLIKLSEEQVKMFNEQFEIKCTNVLISKGKRSCYVILDGFIKLKVQDINLISNYL